MTSITPIQCNRSIASPDVEATPAADAAAEAGKLGGIEGESTDASHKDWVEVLFVSTKPTSVLPGSAIAPSGTDAVSSFVATYGLHAAASTHASGAKHFADFTFTKKLDSSSGRLGD